MTLLFLCMSVCVQRGVSGAICLGVCVIRTLVHSADGFGVELQ